MDNYYFNDKLYIARIEYFGGLLINKQTMRKYEISRFDILFLMSVKNGLSTDYIIHRINYEFGVDFRPAIYEYIKMNVLLIAEKTGEPCDDNQTQFDSIMSQIKNTTNINYLSAPIELTIYPSLKCQLQCSFCYLRDKQNMSMKEYGWSEWIRLIRGFVDEGIASISILGGEPSMYCDIVPLIQQLNRLGVRFTMTTNGMNWSDELYHACIRAENFTPIFSIESLESKQNMMRMGMCVDTVGQTSLIKRLRGDGKTCRINTVYTNQQDSEIFRIIDFCEEYGLQKYSVALCFDKDNNASSIFQINNLRKRVIEYMNQKNYNKILFSVEGCMIYSSHINFDGNIVKTEYQKKQYGCECGNTILEILPDGSMYSCATYISLDKSLGNAFIHSWKNIWNTSEELTRLRRRICQDDICRGCSLCHFCNGGCPAYIELNGGDICSSYDDRCLIHKHRRELENEHR